MARMIPRGMADMVIFNDRKYYPQYPPSEQIDALKITTKWPRLELDEAAKVRISEAELRNFAQIYPRLYQVSEKTQARLRAWMDRNEETIQGWDVGDFFKTIDDDARDHTQPRRPGCPDEVMEAWNSCLDDQQTDQAFVDQEPWANGSDNHPITSQESRRGLHGQGGQGPEKGCQTVQALEGSLGKIKEVAARLEQLSNNLYLEDINAVKEELLALAQTIKTNVDSTSRARNIVSQLLGKRAVNRRLGRQRQRNRMAKARRDKNKIKENNNNEEDKNNDEEKKDEDQNENKDQWLVWGSGPQPDLASLETEYGLVREHGTFVCNPNDVSITEAVRNNQSRPANDPPAPQDDIPMADVDSRLRTAFIGSYQLRIGPVSDGSVTEAFQDDQDSPVNDLSGLQEDDFMADIGPPLGTTSIGSYQLHNGPVNNFPGPRYDDSTAEAAIDPRLRTAFIGRYQLRNEDCG